MATRLPQWLPAPILLAVGGALGWMLERTLTPDFASDAESAAVPPLPPSDQISRAWLPTAVLHKHLESLSFDDARALLTKLNHSFWCGHPNGRDALHVVVSRMAESLPPNELAREVFERVRISELPAGARAEMVRNLTAALATISAVTPAMVGEALRGFPFDEIRAAAEVFAEERRGESIESDAAALQQLLRAAGMKDDVVAGLAKDLAAAAWFRERPEAAIAFAAKARGFDGAIFRPMLRQLYAVDAPAAVAALKQIASYEKSPRWTGKSAFLTGLSAADFREVASQVSKEERLSCLAGFADELALQAPANVPEFAREFSAAELFGEAFFEQSYRYGELPALLPIFAERDPAACREWLSALTG